VPQLKNLKDTKDDAGVPHLEAVYEHWRPNAGRQREDQFSDGTLRLIGLFWSLLEGDSPVLLEEPELSLHSAIVSRLPALLFRLQRKRKRQVFVSTHSLSEAVLRRLLSHVDRGFAIGVACNRGAYGHLKRTVRGWNRAAAGIPFVLLTDLDNRYNCPPATALIALAAKSRRADIRDRIVPKTGSTARQGPDYNGCHTEFVRGDWDIDVSSEGVPQPASCLAKDTRIRPGVGPALSCCHRHGSGFGAPPGAPSLTAEHAIPPHHNTGNE
jgi:hypothetical protein